MKNAIERRVPIDFPKLFAEAGIAPRRCKLAYSMVADSWALMIEEDDGLTVLCVTPPPAEDGEERVVIDGSDWLFRRSVPRPTSLSPVTPFGEQSPRLGSTDGRNSVRRHGP